MATVISKSLAAILDFFIKFILRKTAANCTEISRKHVFAASKRNIMKNRVEKKKFNRTNFVKIKSCGFLFQTLICIISYAYIIWKVSF